MADVGRCKRAGWWCRLAAPTTSLTRSLCLTRKRVGGRRWQRLLSVCACGVRSVCYGPVCASGARNWVAWWKLLDLGDMRWCVASRHLYPIRSTPFIKLVGVAGYRLYSDFRLINVFLCKTLVVSCFYFLLFLRRASSHTKPFYFIIIMMQAR